MISKRSPNGAVMPTLANGCEDVKCCVFVSELIQCQSQAFFVEFNEIGTNGCS